MIWLLDTNMLVYLSVWREQRGRGGSGVRRAERFGERVAVPGGVQDGLDHAGGDRAIELLGLLIAGQGDAMDGRVRVFQETQEAQMVSMGEVAPSDDGDDAMGTAGKQ